MAEKALFITNIPTPYRLPLLNAMYDQLTAKGVSFRVIFGALGYERRKWRVDMNVCRFPYEVLRSATIPLADPEGATFTYPGLSRILQREQPGAILTNAFSPATTKLWLRSFIKPTPYIIWSGATHRAGQPDHWARVVHRRLLIKRAAGFVAYGSQAREYLVDLGARREDISVGINTVDTEFFARDTERQRQSITPATDKKRVLFIGDLVPRKGVGQLLRVIQNLTRLRQDFVLDVIGAGVEKDKVQELAGELGIRNYINFLGFKQKEEMPFYMARSDVFVFPTLYDIWGLVLVEAMAAGLACVSSIHAGATWDLIQDGETGLAVDFAQVEKVAEKLHWLLNSPAECRRLGQRAKDLIARSVTIRNSAEGFVAAIERVLRQQRG